MFSVIIPLYNKASYIIRALDSVFAQIFLDFEVIVVNDGSTDGGGDLVNEKFGNRVNYIQQANSGVSSARNSGIKAAKGEFLAFLDADDIWHPEYLSLIQGFILSYPQLKIFGTSYSKIPLTLSPIDPLIKPILFNHYFKEAIRNTYFFTSATVYSKEVFSDELQFDVKLKLGEDLDVLFQAILNFKEALYFPVPLVYYGQEDNSSEVKKTHSFHHTLVSKIYRYEGISTLKMNQSEQWDEFSIFRDKWVLFNLYRFFDSSPNSIQAFLKSLSQRYFLAELFYKIPHPVQKLILSSPFLSSILRKYLKFCFRYIYTR